MCMLCFGLAFLICRYRFLLLESSILLIFVVFDRDCCVADTSKQDPKSCITVAIVGITKDSYAQLDILRDFVMPFLLRTVVKGFIH